MALNPQTIEIDAFLLIVFFKLTQSILFKSEQVKFVNYHKHLGLTLETGGSWQKHIDNVVSKCCKMIDGLRKLYLDNFWT